MATQAPIILDDDEPQPLQQRDSNDRSRDGFEISLASIVIGAMLMIFGMLAPVFLGGISSSNGHYSGRRTNLIYFETGCYATVMFVVVINIVGIIYGMRGISIRAREGGSKALPVTGLLFCILSLGLWLLSALLVITKI